MLHASQLYIDPREVKIDEGNGKVMALDRVLFDPDRELMFVKSTTVLKVNEEYLLTIPFAGNITDNLVGYYRSSFVDKMFNYKRYAMLLSDGEKSFVFDNVDFRLSGFFFGQCGIGSRVN